MTTIESIDRVRTEARSINQCSKNCGGPDLLARCFPASPETTRNRRSDRRLNADQRKIPHR